MLVYLIISGKRLAAAAAGAVLVLILSVLFVRGVLTAPISAMAGGAETVTVPILMYHSILKDASRTGVYVVTPQQLECDLQYLKENGYQSVTMQELVDYVHFGTPLPEKPVVLTFDDGHLNNMVYATPLLEAYGMRGVLSVVGMYCDQATDTKENNISYSYLTWDQVAEVQEKGVFELQNHSYSMHFLDRKRKGTLPMEGESAAQYQQALVDDLGRMQERLTAKTGVTPTTFTYPFGFYSKGSREILQSMGFQATLICEEGVNCITQGDPDCLFDLKRILRSGNDATFTVMKNLCD
jgi:peptidoglycan/xylan/chitin deacetylase (PgdA/CDA1 family)